MIFWVFVVFACIFRGMDRNTIVFAFGAFGCAGIQALRHSGFNVALVLTHDDHDAASGESVAALCAGLHIPCEVMEGREEAAMARMRAVRPAYIFSFYYRALLPEEILGLAAQGAFNLHTSLLPKYRGRAPVNWVLVNGETQTGVSLHHMVARADAGDIVAQKAVAIAYEDTAYTLQQKLLAAAKAMLAEALPKIASGTAQRVKQDLSKGMYCGRRRPEDGRIDWTWDAERVRNLVRAVTLPFPGAFTMAGGRKLMVWEAKTVDGSGRPGEVISVEPLTVACGQRAVVIVSGQFEGEAEASGGGALGLAQGEMLG